MSDAYYDDLEAEQALFDQLAESEARAALMEPLPNLGGRPPKVQPIKLVAWRQAHKASIRETAARWSVSEATVKRLSRDYGEAAKLERARWESERLDRELEAHEHGYSMMYFGQRSRHLALTDLEWFGRCERAKGTAQEAAMLAAREAALEKADAHFRENWERCMGPIPAP